MKKCCSVPCHNGYYPIHEAAKCASARTLEVILKWGKNSLLILAIMIQTNLFLSQKMSKISKRPSPLTRI